MLETVDHSFKQILIKQNQAGHDQQEVSKTMQAEFFCSGFCYINTQLSYFSTCSKTHEVQQHPHYYHRPEPPLAEYFFFRFIKFMPFRFHKTYRKHRVKDKCHDQ